MFPRVEHLLEMAVENLGQFHAKCIRETEGKRESITGRKLEAPRETWTVLGSFTSFGMARSTRGGYIRHGRALGDYPTGIEPGVRLTSEPIVPE